MLKQLKQKKSPKSVKLMLLMNKNNEINKLNNTKTNNLKLTISTTHSSDKFNLQSPGNLKLVKTSKSIFNKFSSKEKAPKIYGEIRHYPPANKEWKNSVYSYNKNNITSTAALDNSANKLIKRHFNLANNKKLARSHRMRTLIRRASSKRIFTSKPEIKQYSDKVNITVYIYNREGQFLLRKLYFYKKNMNINRHVFLHKLWLKNNLSAFKKTFQNKKSFIVANSIASKNTKRKKINKTYVHNLLMKTSVDRPLSYNENLNSLESSDENSNSNGSVDISVPSLEEKDELYKFIKNDNFVHSDDNNNKTSLNKSFNNYLIKKESPKLNYRLRKLYKEVEIKKNLSKFHYIRNGARIRVKKARFKKIKFPYSNLRSKKEINFFSFKLVSGLKYIRKLFIFYFIKYMFSLLQIMVYKRGINRKKVSKQQRITGNKFIIPGLSIAPREKRIKAEALTINNLTSKSYNSLQMKKEFSPKQFTINSVFSNFIKKPKLNIRKNLTSQFSFKKMIGKNKYSENKLRLMNQINLELLNYLKLIYSKRMKEPETSLLSNSETFKDTINSMYKKFENKYYIFFLSKYFKREFLYVNYYTKFLLNKFKFGKYLPGLKHSLSKIYNKKVELNLVNLKYPQLNSDIYADLVVNKLKKKLSLWKVLRKSLSLTKLPYDYVAYNKLDNVNKIESLNIEKTLNVFSTDDKNLAQDNIIKDKLDIYLNNIYTNLFMSDAQVNTLSRIANGTSSSKNLKVLNLIKFKWVSGVRLEAAGRLTRRYTAARSVFKFKYKGSLKNIDYSQRSDPGKRNMSAVMLRNYAKANAQYSFAKGKRRIGAFGLKVKLASY